MANHKQDSILMMGQINMIPKVKFFLFQSIDMGTTLDVELPLGQGMSLVRPPVQKPDDKDAIIAMHQSRMQM